jgi:hypothetical protein
MTARRRSRSRQRASAHACSGGGSFPRHSPRTGWRLPRPLASALGSASVYGTEGHRAEQPVHADEGRKPRLAGAGHQQRPAQAQRNEAADERKPPTPRRAIAAPHVHVETVGRPQRGRPRTTTTGWSPTAISICSPGGALTGAPSRRLAASGCFSRLLRRPSGHPLDSSTHRGFHPVCPMSLERRLETMDARVKDREAHQSTRSNPNARPLERRVPWRAEASLTRLQAVRWVVTNDR